MPKKSKKNLSDWLKDVANNPNTELLNSIDASALIKNIRKENHNA